ncbi:MAG: hypothetical protein BroJett018_27330 [Chloroflexota bacterium]|nr:MAG: hypothetical protein BroJett018_27330 [Chloroflexota bacterium]
MSKITGRIFLIVEADRDGRYAKTIVQRCYPSIEVHLLPPKGHNRGIGALAEQIERLLKEALLKKQTAHEPACVAVLHDADESSTPNRNLHTIIRDACQKHKKQVILVLAKDEMESWLMADSGVCAWLDKKPKNWDEETHPSKTFESWLDKAGKGKYDDAIATQIAAKLMGDGGKVSPSLKSALQHLIDAPCTKSED